MSGSRVTRAVLAIASAAISLLALAPMAMAADGEGTWGRTDDRVITFFAFGVIAFFAILVIVQSLIQIRLDGRKERLREELQRVRR